MGARKKARNGRGGARPGAGRKPVLRDPVPWTIPLEREDLDALRRIARERGETVAGMVRQAVKAVIRRHRRRT